MFRITRLPHGEGLPLPSRQSPQAAGMDVYAAVGDDVIIAQGKRSLIATGIKIALPEGFEAQIRPRSGLALSHGITVLNSPGTIDADYRGEVKVLLVNHGDCDYTVKRGERIAQMVVLPVTKIEWTEVLDIDEGETLRGQGGYGSTGG